MKMSSFHSADVKLTPPDGWGLRPDEYPFDTSALLSSASEYPCPTGNLGALGAGAACSIGEGGLRARTFAAMIGGRCLSINRVRFGEPRPDQTRVDRKSNKNQVYLELERKGNG